MLVGGEIKNWGVGGRRGVKAHNYKNSVLISICLQ